jgi:hypothetical protein
MHVRAKPDIVGKVPAVVIGIGIQDDVVTVPEPVAGITGVVWGHLEEEPVDIESVAPASSKPPDVLRPDRPREASLSPWMIETIVGIVATGVVSHPRVVLGMDVWGFGVARLIPEGAAAGRRGIAWLGHRSVWRPNRSRSPGRHMPAAHTPVAAARRGLPALSLRVIALLALPTALLIAASLSEREDRKAQHHWGESDEFSHAHSTSGLDCHVDPSVELPRSIGPQDLARGRRSGLLFECEAPRAVRHHVDYRIWMSRRKTSCT